MRAPASWMGLVLLWEKLEGPDLLCLLWGNTYKVMDSQQTQIYWLLHLGLCSPDCEGWVSVVHKWPSWRHFALASQMAWQYLPTSSLTPSNLFSTSDQDWYLTQPILHTEPYNSFHLTQNKAKVYNGSKVLKALKGPAPTTSSICSNFTFPGEPM